MESVNKSAPSLIGGGTKHTVKINGKNTVVYHYSVKKSISAKPFNLRFDCLYTDRLTTTSVTISFPHFSISLMQLLKEFFSTNSAQVGFERNTEIYSSCVTPYGCSFMTVDKKVFSNIISIYKYLATKKLSARANKMFGVSYPEIRKMLKEEFAITVIGKCKIFYDSLTGATETRKKKLATFQKKLGSIAIKPATKEEDFSSSNPFAGIQVHSTADIDKDTLRNILLSLQHTSVWVDSKCKCLMSDTDNSAEVEAVVRNRSHLIAVGKAHEKRFGNIAEATKQELQEKSAVALFHIRGCKQGFV